MRPLITYLSLLSLAVITIPATAQTRDSTPAARRQAALLLDHTFTAAIGEPIKVFLAKDMNYRVETQGTGIQLQLRPLELSLPTPLLSPLTGGTSAAGGSIYVVTPKADGVYEFISAGGDPQQPVRLRVYAAPSKGKRPGA